MGYNTHRQQQHGNGKGNIPRHFCCPLTLEVMSDPVLDREGNTFERGAVVAWLESNKTSPVSREPLNEGMLVPNIALRDTINDFMGQEWVAKKEAAAMEKGRRSQKANGYSHDCACQQKIESFLREMPKSIGTRLRLNKQGICAFRHCDFTVCLEVPKSNGSFFLYTSEVLPVLTTDTKDRMLELNYLQQETRGGCLSVQKVPDGWEVVFSYMDRVFELNAQDFKNILENFIDTTIKLRMQILPRAELIPCDENEISQGLFKEI